MTQQGSEIMTVTAFEKMTRRVDQRPHFIAAGAKSSEDFPILRLLLRSGQDLQKLVAILREKVGDVIRQNQPTSSLVGDGKITGDGHTMNQRLVVHPLSGQPLVNL